MAVQSIQASNSSNEDIELGLAKTSWGLSRPCEPCMDDDATC